MSVYENMKSVIRYVFPGFAYNYMKRAKHYIDNATVTPKIVRHSYGGT
jgi:hypothetical protein